MGQSESDQAIYFDALLTPNDSLSSGAFAIIMAIICGAAALSGLMFLSMGALPVVGFFGLDIAALYLAFRWHRGRNKEQTRVVVTADALHLHHRDKTGREKSARLPSAFVRVELAKPVSVNSWLRIEHGRTAFVIGRFLTPGERSSLADALHDALRRARAERHPAQVTATA